MAGIPASNESSYRRSIRMAVGVTLGFLIAQVFAWPLAFAVPVVAIILLTDPAPLSIRGGLKVFINSVLFILAGGCVTWLLTPWPVILVLVAVSLVYVTFVMMFTAGAPLLEFIATLVAFIVIPVLIVLLPELGFIAIYGFALDFAAGIAVSWVAWAIVPMLAAPPEDDHGAPMSYGEAAPLATILTLLVGGLLAVFLVMGWAKVLVLVYSVFFALNFSSYGGLTEGRTYIIANVVYGAAAFIICYLLVIMVPSLPFVIALVFLGVFLFSMKLFSGGPTSAFWSSGLYGFVIMFGSQLLADKASLVTVAGRVWQLVLATIFITFAFSVLEWIQGWGKSTKASQKGETHGQVETG